jgi:nitrate/TMAO reductase-like tetraheme cytochrome c subunit
MRRHQSRSTAHSQRPDWLAAVSFALGATLVAGASAVAAGGSRFAHSDSDARYLHQIHLYDLDNRRIGPESTRPYSSLNTCGRCHDYGSISHGWHFNAFAADSSDGRPGEPWFWTDPRTGTQLPLSYRDWPDRFDPEQLGIDRWEMVRQFGGRLPGGGLGIAPQPAAEEGSDPNNASTTAGEPPAGSGHHPRWPLSGSLEIDCLACHGVSGSYDFNARREQVADENFAWAATAGLKLGSIKGQVARIKDGADLADEATQKRMPTVDYDADRFAEDGTVFVDLVRSPENNACYQCHSQRQVTESGIAKRWVHDRDVHLRAGMQCVDCHRNGIDHHTVRGFHGEQHPSGQNVVTLSCAGCHLGQSFVQAHGSRSHGLPAAADAGDDAARAMIPDTGQGPASIDQRAGRLGSPRPAHAGLPPLHFEKLACTACHGGPLPREEALGLMTSLAHGLGTSDHRSGEELPRLLGPVYAKDATGRVAPHRVAWPAFWASLEAGTVRPLHPDQVHSATRRALRVRNDFTREVVRPELGRRELRELLGEQRARLDPEQWSKAEQAQVAEASRQAGEALFTEKVAAALEAIEEEWDIEQAVYVSSGFVYARDGEGVRTLQVDRPEAIDMLRWPLAHNVRPAGWSLGAGGCTECHSDSGLLFSGTVAASGPGPDRGAPISMAALQGVDADQRESWNRMFARRATFKYVIAGSIAVLTITLVIAVGLSVARLTNRWQAALPSNTSEASA